MNKNGFLFLDTQNYHNIRYFTDTPYMIPPNAKI